MTALGFGKMLILVPDWSRLKSLEPKAGDVKRKINPLYFKEKAFSLSFQLFQLVLNFFTQNHLVTMFCSFCKAFCQISFAEKSVSFNLMH